MASSSSSSSSSSSYNTPCAACKFLRRKCMPGCIFASYFPPEDPHKFANVHKIFGASNVAKLLNDLLPHQRNDAVNSLAYEAEARIRNPVYGCVGAILHLQREVQRLQKELDAANADILRYACRDMHPFVGAMQGIIPPPPPPPPVRPVGHHHDHQQFGGFNHDHHVDYDNFGGDLSQLLSNYPLLLPQNNVDHRGGDHHHNPK
uniref:LOB domain-containing protein n=1 Tax=Opuntia streptacantha TaxID=393608 RepID=A0A7C9DJ68_OPUST